MGLNVFQIVETKGYFSSIIKGVLMEEANKNKKTKKKIEFFKNLKCIFKDGMIFDIPI